MSNKQKQLQPTELIVKSLINLRSEMIACGNNEITQKINSCLYSEHPHDAPQQNDAQK